MNEQMEEIEKEINDWKEIYRKTGIVPYALNLVEARKSQLQTDMKIVEELKEKLKKKFKSNITVISKREFLNEIDKLFKEIER